MLYILTKMVPKNNKHKIIVIVGPTASGKSDLALRLARLAQSKAFKKMNINGAEIISADSRQVYRGMNLGTGKVPRDKNSKSEILNPKQYQNQSTQRALSARPSSQTIESSGSKFKIQNQDHYSSGIKHYLIDVADPKKQFTVSDFKILGEKALFDIARRSKLPIIVGGTGFYIDILLDRMAIAQVPPNNKLRERFDRFSVEHLFKMLQKLDPERAKIIDQHNKRRLVRALEIAITTKESSLSNPQFVIRNSQYDILWLGINPSKEKMAKNIKKRLDARLGPSCAKASAGRQGMIKEVEKLHKQGMSWKRLDDFGLEYRWISRYLREVKSKKLKARKARWASGPYRVKSFENTKYYEKLLREIIKYSKRQMTWFKKNKEINWIKNKKEATRLAKIFVL